MAVEGTTSTNYHLSGRKAGGSGKRNLAYQLFSVRVDDLGCIGCPLDPCIPINDKAFLRHLERRSAAGGGNDPTGLCQSTHIDGVFPAWFGTIVGPVTMGVGA